MKLLVIGSGGREHAIAWKAAQNPEVERIYCAPGNGGTFLENKCVNAEINDISGLTEFAKDMGIDLTIVGPEVYLTAGIVDAFKEAGLRIFGPSRDAAQLEGSKVFGKEFMKKYGVKTPSYESFRAYEYDAALEYLRKSDYPVVIKADGLAAGKGVVICQDYETAEGIVNDFMIKDIFKGSGKTIVIEEFLEGVEASVLAITDGEAIIPFVSAKDHKQILDGGRGANTGGMGVLAPNPYFTDEVKSAFENEIMHPTLNGIKQENMDYTGILFFGIMITSKGVYNLEYNVRMGDPETEAVLPLMETDFVELINKVLAKKLTGETIKWKAGFSCCVIAASEGYPGDYKTGYEITYPNDITSKVFIAGAKHENNKLITSGGRVIAVAAQGETVEIARERAYMDLMKVKFEGMYYRRDIGEISE